MADTVRTISRDALAAIYPSPAPLHPGEIAAIERLIAVAKGDTGQSRKVASFLLARWNAHTCGGFDLTDLWAVDVAIALDMQTVIGVVACGSTATPTCSAMATRSARSSRRGGRSWLEVVNEP